MNVTQIVGKVNHAGREIVPPLKGKAFDAAVMRAHKSASFFCEIRFRDDKHLKQVGGFAQEKCRLILNEADRSGKYGIPFGEGFDDEANVGTYEDTIVVPRRGTVLINARAAIWLLQHDIYRLLFEEVDGESDGAPSIPVPEAPPRGRRAASPNPSPNVAVGTPADAT